MIMWTIVPEEIIFADEKLSPALYEEIDYAGQKVMVEKVSPHQYRIVRLLTTNPDDYLRGDLQPGALIAYKPVFEALS